MQPKNSLPSSRLFRHQSIIPKLTTPSHTSETCRKKSPTFFTHKNVINYQRCINALNISEIFFYVIFVVCRLSFFIFFQCVFYRIIQIRYYIILLYYYIIILIYSFFQRNTATTSKRQTTKDIFTTYATFFHTFLVYSKILRIFAPSFER